MNPRIAHCLALVLALVSTVLPGPAGAIDPSEVRDYAEVFRLSAQATTRDRIEVSWVIAPDYYLYDNDFLAFEAVTPGVRLGEPEVPPGDRQFDELLGEEVVKFRGSVSMGVPVIEAPAGLSQVTLNVRSQGCLDKVLCYPPTRQQVTVTLPAASTGSGFVDQLLSGGPAATADGAAPLADSDGRAPALAPDAAFTYEAIGLSAETALVRFTAQPGYYLYVDKFRFRVVGSPDIEVREAVLPPGTIKDDPEFGPVPVIYDQVEIPVRFNRPAGPETTLVLEADYQGCRDGDICYPPQTGRVELLLSAASTDLYGEVVPVAQDNAPTGADLAPVSEQSRLARMLLENPDGALLAFFFAGILLAFTPCVFPMVPILSGIIAGEGDQITTGRALALSVVYVLAMAVTYTVAGVLAGLFGQNLQAVFQNPWIISFFVAIFIALALSMFGYYELQLPSRWQTRLTEQSNRLQGGKLGGVAVMGFLSALIVGPCVAPPLAAALIVIGSSGSPVLGGSALFAMSMGMGVPLILFGLSAGKFLPRAGAWMNAVKAVFGVGLLALGIWMLERILPGGVIMVLWGLLALACGVYLGALERIEAGAAGIQRLWKALGVALLLFGAIQLVGAASGGNYWLQPLKHFSGGGASGSHAEAIEFRRVKSVDDLRNAVAQANASGRPALLDFYADWCVECIRMERNTFPDDRVQALLETIQPLQADVTAHDDIDQALMAEFGIIGPPAILFFDRRGEEMEAYRLVGYFDPPTFAAHLQKVLDAR